MLVYSFFSIHARRNLLNFLQGTVLKRSRPLKNSDGKQTISYLENKSPHLVQPISQPNLAKGTLGQEYDREFWS